MFCPNCGTQNSDTAKFCSNCATPLAVSPNLPQQQQPNYSAPYGAVPVSDVSDGLKIGLAIVSFFVPIVGIIMGIIYMMDPSPAKKEAGKLWLIVSIAAIVLGFGSCCFFGGLGRHFRGFGARM